MAERSSRSVVWMLAGTVLVGLSGYVFFAVIGHGRFDAATSAALAATYLLSNILGPGVFIAAEQEASRVISGQRAGTAHPGTDQPNPAQPDPAYPSAGLDRSTVHRLALICAGLGVLTLLVLGLCAPLLLANVLDGDVGLVLALMLAVIGSAAVYYIRGLVGGQQRFHRYAATTGVDGGARILGCLGLVAAGSTNPVAYALALCAGPAVAAVLTCRAVAPVGSARTTTSTSGPTFAKGAAKPPATTSAAVTPKAATVNVPMSNTPTTATLARGVAYLLVASFVSMAMANLAPVIVTGLDGTDPIAATGFAAAVVLTRVPLLLMGPIQALILPRLTLAAGEGRLADFRRDTARGLAIIGGLAVLAVAGVALLGHWALQVLVGTDGDTTSTTVLLALTASAMLQMAVQFLQPALVAVRRHRMLVVAWLSGGLAFGLAFLVPLDPIDRGVLAQLIGPSVTLIVELIALQVAVGASRHPSAATPMPRSVG